MNVFKYRYSGCDTHIIWGGGGHNHLKIKFDVYTLSRVALSGATVSNEGLLNRVVNESLI